jgi:hypothetical protein
MYFLDRELAEGRVNGVAQTFAKHSGSKCLKMIAARGKILLNKLAPRKGKLVVAQVMKTHRGTGGIDPLTLYLGARWR